MQLPNRRRDRSIVGFREEREEIGKKVVGFFQRGENLFGHNIDRFIELPVIGRFYRVVAIAEIVFET